MNTPWRVLLFILLLTATGQVPAIDARVIVRVAGDGPFWVGQRIPVEVDLLSTGFRFGNQQFDLPDLPGAVLLPPGGAMLNLSESIAGEAWQGLRYQLSLFVLEPGIIRVPPLTVAFSVAAGYGSDPKPFRFSSEPLQIQVRQPPGADGLSGLVTTSRFELETGWEPEPGGLKVGDALTLTVRRRATEVLGAAIPPFAHGVIDGLAAYPAEPEIRDLTGRGGLTGERVDRITYLLQAAGDYRLPGSTLHWFDPTTNTLHTEEIAPLEFTVAPNPDAKLSSTQTAMPEPGAGPVFLWPVVVATAVLFLVLFGSGRAMPRLQAWRRARQAAWAISEAGRFNALLAACRRGDPAAADRTLTAWLRTVVPGTTTATTFAAGDAELAGAVTELQAALAYGRSDWSGETLARVLRRTRRFQLKRETERRRQTLPPLNPGDAA